MLRCTSPSSSEHKESSEEVSEEASEAKDSLTEASELSGTEETCSEHIGSMWVEESTVSEFSLPRTEEEEEEEEGREGEGCGDG